MEPARIFSSSENDNSSSINPLGLGNRITNCIWNISKKIAYFVCNFFKRLKYLIFEPKASGDSSTLPSEFSSNKEVKEYTAPVSEIIFTEKKQNHYVKLCFFYRCYKDKVTLLMLNSLHKN